MLTYSLTLALTLGIELLVVWLATRGDRRAMAVRACVAMNLFTHPLATLLMMSGRGSFLQVEFLVIFVEALLYLGIVRWTAQRALAVAFVANVLSMLAGIGHSIFLTAG